MRLLAPRHLLRWVLSGLAGLACAPTSPDLPPAEEVLLVVDSTENNLRVVPVNSPSSSAMIALGGISPTPVGVSARNEIALVPMGLDNSVALVALGICAAAFCVCLEVSRRWAAGFRSEQ